jgi:two-component system OmpR family response regulator
VTVTASEDLTTSGRDRILVVDDETNITDLLRMSLEMHGFTVEVAHTGGEAVRAVQEFSPDFIILDVMLPDVDGYEVHRQVLEMPRHASTPVLFLTARGTLDDRLRGLVTGDDYMVKPFSVEEILLRIKVILRRVSLEDGTPPRFCVGDIELDEERHQVWRASHEIDLTPTEFRLLHYLMANADRVVSKPQIRDWVWDYEFGGKVNMVEVYVSFLRAKLDAFGPRVIRTVRGVGYCLRSVPELSPTRGAVGDT